MKRLKAVLPNALTFSRFPLSAGFYFLIVREYFAEAMGLLILAQATDWLDGAFARRWNVQTRFGVVVEHIADTFMLSMLGLGLTQIGVIPPWVFLASLGYCALTWITPQRIKRLWVLNVVLGMRTLLYGTALAITPFMLLKMIAEEKPLLALAILGLFVLYGIATLYWKRGRIYYYWRRFWRGVHSTVSGN